LPDVAGRLRAVPVALIVAAIIVSVIPTAATSATAPAGLDRFLYALGEVESGGNYYARNPYSGAYGKYQIMPSNWPGWAKLYVGNSAAPQTPANQERVAHGKVTALWNWLDTWQNVAHWWLTGSGERNQAYWSTYSKSYVAKVMKIYNATADTAGEAVVAPPPPPPVGVVDLSSRRVQESSGAIAFSAHWLAATHSSYAGDRVLYSSTDGATATFRFTARNISWVGPVGPTRGRARVLIDGRTVATIDLRRSTFTAQARLFSKSWSTVGTHTIKIRVIGSGRPVAIDEFILNR
jgi:hypothetical protein